jgi:hypothetical protein
MDGLAFKLKAANTLRGIKGQLDSLTDGSGNTPLSIYVRFYFYGACALLAFLSFISLFTKGPIEGIVCL